MTGCKGTKIYKSISALPETSFDLHTHPGVFFMRGSERYPGDSAFVQRIEDMKSNGLNAAFFSLVADWPLLQITEKGIVPSGTFGTGEGWIAYKKQMEDLHQLLQTNKIKIATKTTEINDPNELYAFISCEGGDFLDGEIQHVNDAYADGVRSIQLVHYAPNSLGDLQTWKAEHGGLSDFGKNVVKKMNELGMLIDVAHASSYTVKDTVNISTDPIILSHSILNDNIDRPISARAISIEHAKMVADTGGVIGMWPSGFSTTLEEFADHTMRMINAVGIDHVGIGTDMDGNFKPVISNYAEFNSWKTALAEKGLSNEDVDKVAGGNAVRVLKKVLKA
jgi:membrane dipeptidase